MKEQLLLGVALSRDATFENYYIGKNAELYTALRHAVQEATPIFIYLFGKAGVGRSHLLQACCHLATTLHKTSLYLPLREIPLSSDMFEGLEAIDVICIDDIGVLAGHRDLEEAFFACYNRVRESGKVLIISGHALPSLLPLTLKDVASRLSWGLTFHVDALDDQEQKAALQFGAKKRGFELPEEVAAYILKRNARESKALFALLDKLDHASLAEHRKLTIPFVREIMY